MPLMHKLGLLLGAETDWPRAFEKLVETCDLDIPFNGTTHRFTTERVTIEPFRLRAEPDHDVVIDRLAHWYDHPREWLKKVALMDETYLLNNPFTFQSMEKHAAYCALMRMGFKVPETTLVPHKRPPDDARFPYTSEHYNKPFDLAAVAEEIGYPLYMKPFDGGAWVGVSRIENADDLRRAYDESGRMMMHLQATVDFDVFARSLSIGAETMTMRFEPDRPMYDRYQVDHAFLDAQQGREARIINRVVNAFFRWEFNSCESLVKGSELMPIDYANACPDVAITSLHYYFPWAITRLLKWSVFVSVVGRRMPINLTPLEWFRIGDDPERSYEEKLDAYEVLADDYFMQGAYEEFSDRHLGHVDEAMAQLVDSPFFDDLLVETVTGMFPEHEHERFVAHFRGLLRAWVDDARAAGTASVGGAG